MYFSVRVLIDLIITITIISFTVSFFSKPLNFGDGPYFIWELFHLLKPVPLPLLLLIPIPDPFVDLRGREVELNSDFVDETTRPVPLFAIELQ